VWSGGRLFVLTGQAGIGKSRLLDAFAEARPGTLVLRARPGDDKVPLATLDRLVHRLGARWPALGAERSYARFIAQLSGPRDGQAPTVQSVAPIVAELLRAAHARGLAGSVLDDLRVAEALADIYLDLGRPELAHRPLERFTAATQHSPRLRQHALMLRWGYRLATGGGIDISAALAQALASENLLLAGELLLTAGRTLRAEPTPIQCAALIERLGPEPRGLLAPLHALRAWLLASAGAVASAEMAIAEAEYALQSTEAGATTPASRLWLARAPCATAVALATRRATRGWPRHGCASVPCRPCRWSFATAFCAAIRFTASCSAGPTELASERLGGGAALGQQRVTHPRDRFPAEHARDICRGVDNAVERDTGLDAEAVE
jgi:hypothetical protein